MIKDPNKWNLALARFSGFTQSVREPYDEDKVQVYENIVAALEGAASADLSSFKIPAERLKRRVINARKSSFSGQPDHTQYSDHKECDPEFFRSQLLGLANYIPIIKGDSSKPGSSPYESLSDDQLKTLLADRKLKPKRVTDVAGERYVFERADGIAKLLRDDVGQSSQAVSHISNVYNIRDSNIVQNSPGSSISKTLGFKSEELRKIVAELKLFSAIEGIAPENQKQIKTDAATLDVQLESGNPNPAIVGASLESAKAIVEQAGVAQGQGVLAAIRSYLGLA